jgi:hypothetical protein
MSPKPSQAMSDAAALQARGRKFDEKTFLQCLLKFIAADDQVCFHFLVCIHYAHVSSFKSLNVVECPEFRSLLLSVGGDFTESQIPGRTKLRELVIQAWRDYFEQLRRDLAVSLVYLLQYFFSGFCIQMALGQISFTMDIWSDPLLQSYLALTAHWIAEVPGTSALQLKTALIAFHRLCGSHSGRLLAKTVMRLLDRAGITAKVRQLCSHQH